MSSSEPVLKRATSGRLLAIGDIHGCHVALESLLDKVQIVPTDTLVVLGDVIDRGPGTRQVIDRLLECRDRCRVALVMGNHEEMLLEVLRDDDSEEDWLGFGGIETLESYGGEELDLIPPAHVQFLQSAVDYFETGSAVFIHANLKPGVPLARQTAEWLRWTKLTRRENPLPSGQHVVCGHTPQKDGLPWVGDGWTCIDTFAYGGMYVTCLDVNTRNVWQASQTGESRGPVPLDECRATWGT